MPCPCQACRAADPCCQHKYSAMEGLGCRGKARTIAEEEILDRGLQPGQAAMRQKRDQAQAAAPLTPHPQRPQFIRAHACAFHSIIFIGFGNWITSETHVGQSDSHNACVIGGAGCAGSAPSRPAQKQLNVIVGLHPALLRAAGRHGLVSKSEGTMYGRTQRGMTHPNCTSQGHTMPPPLPPIPTCEWVFRARHCCPWPPALGVPAPSLRVCPTCRRPAPWLCPPTPVLSCSSRAPPCFLPHPIHQAIAPSASAPHMCLRQRLGGVQASAASGLAPAP